MHLHWRTQCAARCLGEIVLNSWGAHFDLCDLWKACKLTRRSSFVYFRAASMELTLYSRKWCSWCIDAKDYLKEKGYCFQEIDVGKDRQAYENMKQLSSQTYVPTFVAGDKVLANFDTNQLEKFLTEHQINPQETSS
jgi:glutaredoxin 3